MPDNETPTSPAQPSGSAQGGQQQPKSVAKPDTANAASAKTADIAQSETASTGTGGSKGDVLSILKAEHREIEKLFDAYEKATRTQQKKKLAAQIAQMVDAHGRLKAEVFYPALKGKVDEALLDKAHVQQESSNVLVEDIRSGSPADDYYDAKVTVLGEMVKQHAADEEKGVFAKAKSAGIDLQAMAKQMSARKAEIAGEAPSNIQRKERDMPQQGNRGRDIGGRNEWSDDGRRYRQQAGHSRDHDDGHPQSMPGRDEYGRMAGDDERSRGYAGERYGRTRPEDDEDDARYERAGSRASGGRDQRHADDDRRYGSAYGHDGGRQRGSMGTYGEGETRYGRGESNRMGDGNRSRQEDDWRHGGSQDRNRNYNAGYQVSRGSDDDDDRGRDHGRGDDDQRRYGSTGPRERWPEDQRGQRQDYGRHTPDEDDHRGYSGGGRDRYDEVENAGRERSQWSRARSESDSQANNPREHGESYGRGGRARY